MERRILRVIPGLSASPRRFAPPDSPLRWNAGGWERVRQLAFPRHSVQGACGPEPSVGPIPWRAPTRTGRAPPPARGHQFVLGRNSVIQGWEKGFASMKKGEKAVLTCKPEYAYGASGSPPKIPANATLNFEVELLDFHPKKKERWEMTTEERVQEVRFFPSSLRPPPRARPLTALVADCRRRSSRRRATSTSRRAGGRTRPPSTATRRTWPTSPATARTARRRRTWTRWT